jgi:glycosyltransferase involved in cell wall biosynthesis
VNDPKVSICLATYNGGKYLKEQLDSIFAQSNTSWKLLIRDDGSIDNSLGIIEDYTIKYPNKITLITDKDGRIGPCMSFARLLDRANTEYIMFCDQDDVWLPNKIELTLNAMKQAEQAYPDQPLLVHTDLKVVDSNLNTICDSMWRYQRLSPEIGENLVKIMAQNVVTGCAMMINKKVKKVSTPIPKEAVMHDWWIAVNVAKHGKIMPVSIPSILYRQHVGNEKGAQKTNVLQFAKKLPSWGQLLLNHYRMIKELNFKVSFWFVLVNKIFIKIRQLCR